MTTRSVLEVEGTLDYYDQAGQRRSLNVARDLEGWQVWLDRGESFVVQQQHPAGYVVNAYTARLERAKGKNACRWYGYTRRGGKLYKFYLGRSQDLTLDRLRQFSALGRFDEPAAAQRGC